MKRQLSLPVGETPMPVRPVHDGTVAIGARLWDLYRQFGEQPSEAAVDLVSIALAVTAGDIARGLRETGDYLRDWGLIV